MKKDCPNNKTGNRGRPGRDEKDRDGGTTAVIAEVFLSDTISDEWILDTGATEHMSYDRDSFTDYRELESSIPIRVGNGQIIHGIGVGNIRAMSQLPNGTMRNIVLKNVMYAPNLARKLFSLAATMDAGNGGVLSGKTIVVKDSSGGDLIVAERIGSGRLFRAGIIEANNEAMIAENDEALILHERMGHVNNRRIAEMAKNNVVERSGQCKIPKDHSSRCATKCQGCQLGKQPKMHLGSRSGPRASGVGEKVHVDICGPTGIAKVSGFQYFVLFKDEFSCFRHVYFVKTKDQVFDCLRRSVAAYKGELKRETKALCSDRGSEFTSKRARDFLLDHAIHHSVSAPFTPAQNGFIEPDNRTVAECARTMLAARNVPVKLWGEAIQTAVYVLNRTTNKFCAEKTPFEIVFDRKPTVSHLRVFGALRLAFVKEQHKKRSGYQRKFEYRSKPLMMVGYAEHNFTYRLFDPDTNHIIVSRDVVFDEVTVKEWPTEPQTQAETIKLFEEWAPSDDEISGTDSEKESSSEQNNRASQQLPEIQGQSSAEPSRPAAEPMTEQRGLGTSEANNEKESGDEQSTLACDSPDASDTSQYLDAAAPEAPPQASQSSDQNQAAAQSRYNRRPRTSAATARFGLIAEALASECEGPTTVAQALNSPEADNWRKAMKSEYDSLVMNRTWELCKLPPGRKAIGSRWVFKRKFKSNGELDKYEARLVARGFSQKAGIDYQETFSPVVRLETVRILIALAAHCKLTLKSFDIKTAYLHGTIEEELFMRHPEGFEQPGDYVCRLKKSIYGLKQAGRRWNICFTQFLEKFELKPLKTDHCVYSNADCNLSDLSKESIIIALYVDDGLILSNGGRLIERVITHLRGAFEITIGDASSYVGLQVVQGMSNIMLQQQHYIRRKAELLNMTQPARVDCPLNPSVKSCKDGVSGGSPKKTTTAPFRQLIGALMYAANGTRPDISYAMCSLSRFNQDPKPSHWEAAKRTMRYLISTKEKCIVYPKGEESLQLACYSDADYGNDRDDRKSISGVLILLNKAPVVWRSIKQTKVASSTAVAEFVAAALAAKECIWLRNILFELGLPQSEPTPLFVDNQTAIHLITNNQVHAKTKALEDCLFEI